MECGGKISFPIHLLGKKAFSLLMDPDPLFFFSSIQDLVRTMDFFSRGRLKTQPDIFSVYLTASHNTSGRLNVVAPP